MPCLNAYSTDVRSVVRETPQDVETGASSSEPCLGTLQESLLSESSLGFAFKGFVLIVRVWCGRFQYRSFHLVVFTTSVKMSKPNALEARGESFIAAAGAF